jgi:hypothetical protein
MPKFEDFTPKQLKQAVKSNKDGSYYYLPVLKRINSFGDDTYTELFARATDVTKFANKEFSPSRSSFSVESLQGGAQAYWNNKGITCVLTMSWKRYLIPASHCTELNLLESALIKEFPIPQPQESNG